MPFNYQFPNPGGGGGGGSVPWYNLPRNSPSPGYRNGPPNMKDYLTNLADMYKTEAKPGKYEMPNFVNPGGFDVNRFVESAMKTPNVPMPKFEKFDVGKYSGMLGDPNSIMAELQKTLEGINFDPEKYVAAQRPGLMRAMHDAQGSTNMLMGNTSGFAPGTSTAQQQLLDLAGQEYLDKIAAAEQEAWKTGADLALQKGALTLQGRSGVLDAISKLAGIEQSGIAGNNQNELALSQLIADIQNNSANRALGAGNLALSSSEALNNALATQGNLGLQAWSANNSANQDYLNMLYSLLKEGGVAGLQDWGRMNEWMNSRRPPNVGQR